MVSQDDETQTVRTTSLLGNFPNPFNPSTTILFSLSSGEGRGEGIAIVNIVIYNIRRQRVRTLANQVVEPGLHSVEWDGRNDKDEKLGSGIYLYRLEAGDFREIRRMILLK